MRVLWMINNRTARYTGKQAKADICRSRKSVLAMRALFAFLSLSLCLQSLSLAWCMCRSSLVSRRRRMTATPTTAAAKKGQGRNKNTDTQSCSLCQRKKISSLWFPCTHGVKRKAKNVHNALSFFSQSQSFVNRNTHNRKTNVLLPFASGSFGFVSLRSRCCLLTCTQHNTTHTCSFLNQRFWLVGGVGDDERR